VSRAHRDYAERPARAFAVAGAIDVSKPVEGFYRTKLRGRAVYCGVRIWYGAPLDPVTGEELDRSWRWQALANGEPVELDDVWPVCAANPISEQDYRIYCRRQQWARQNAPDSSFADPRKRHDPLTALLPF